MRLVVTAFLIFTSTFLYSQSFEVSSFFSDAPKNGKIEGVVLDNEINNEPMAFATISDKNTDFETTSDLDGSFSFNLKPGKYTLEIHFWVMKPLNCEMFSLLREIRCPLSKKQVP